MLSATEVEFFNEYDGLVRSYARDCGMELAAVRHGENEEGKERAKRMKRRAIHVTVPIVYMQRIDD